MEGGKVGVFDTGVVEVGVRECASMQSHAMRSITFLATALNCHPVANRDILNITSDLCSSLLIDEDKLVVPRVSVVILHPAVSRVIGVFISLHTSISDTKMRRSRDADEGWCNVGALAVPINHIDEGGDPGKVNDGVIVVDRDGGEVIGCGVGKGFDGGHDVICPSFHGVREQRVSFPIAQDGATQRGGAKHLFWDPELVSPSLRWWRLSRGISQMTRGVKETDFLAGADDGDRFRRRWSSSNT
jgi:hypothetical protein